MSCESCRKTDGKHSDGKGQSVPFVVHESSMARNERTVKRLVIALIVLALLWFATIGIGVYAWMQYYDYSSEQTESVTVDGKDGVANYIGNDGDIVNGIAKTILSYFYIKNLCYRLFICTFVSYNTCFHYDKVNDRLR